MLPDNKGQQLDSYCRGKKVIAVSPNTLYAHLCVIAMGLRGMQIEENATRIFASLSGMHKQMETFTEVFEKLGTHIKNSQQCLQRRRQAPGENTEHAGQPAGHQLHASRAGSAGHAGAADGFDVKAQRLEVHSQNSCFAEFLTRLRNYPWLRCGVRGYGHEANGNQEVAVMVADHFKARGIFRAPGRKMPHRSAAHQIGNIGREIDRL